MLKYKPVLLDFEGFRYKTDEFIIKELSVCGDYLDTVYLYPPYGFEYLTLEERRAYQWQTKFLHGLYWHRGDYPYSFLGDFCKSVVLRYPNSKFYAKGTEKCSVLTNYLRKTVENLEDFGCLKVEEIQSTAACCERHSHLLPNYQADKHCAQRKARIFSNWLINYHAEIEDGEFLWFANTDIPNIESLSISN